MCDFEKVYRILCKHSLSDKIRTDNGGFFNGTKERKERVAQTH